MRRSRGFTILELLIIVGIMVALSTMLLPSYNRIRGLTPWPSAFTFLRRGEDSIRLVLLASEVADAAGATSPGEILEASGDRLVVATGLDALRLTRLQRAGKKPIDAAAFLRGLPIHPGEALAPTA